MIGFDVMLVVGFAAIGLAHIVLASLALRPVARLWFDRTTPLTDVRAGPVEINATARATGTPLRAYDGTPAVAIHRTYGLTGVESGSAFREHNVHDELISVPTELRDGAAACGVDFTSVVLVGHVAEWSADSETFAREHPAVWKLLGGTQRKRAIHDVVVQETCVPDGARCLVSGTARESAATVGEGDYRAMKVGFEVCGTDSRAMIVAAATESEVRRVLARRTVRLWLMALAWGSLAAVTVAALRRLDSIGGLR